MSLNYNLSRIPMYKDNFELAYQEYNGIDGKYTDVKRELKQLIFSSMMVSLSEITYKNVAEWYARLIVCEELNQVSIFERWEGNELIKDPIDPKRIVQYLGLAVNATNRSRSEWVKVMLKNNKDTKYTIGSLTSTLRKLECQFETKVFQ